MSPTPPVPQSDYQKYHEIQARMSDILRRSQGPILPESYGLLWAELEALKNKYGGSIPTNPEDQAR